MKNLITTLLIYLTMSGCSSLNEVKLDTKPASSYVGENLKITTMSDDILELKVESATDLTLYGEGKSVDIADIKTLEVKEFSPLKSISLSAGLYMLGAIIITIVVL